MDRRTDTCAACALVYMALAGEHPLPLADRPEHRAREIWLDATARLPHARVSSGIEVVLHPGLTAEPVLRFAARAAPRAASA